MIAFLYGKKTYIVAIALVLYEVLGYMLGKSNHIDAKTIIEGVGLATVRAAIAKVEAP